MLYFNEPDHSGHKYGPESSEVDNAVIEMDKLLGIITTGYEMGLFVDGSILLFEIPQSNIQSLSVVAEFSWLDP